MKSAYELKMTINGEPVATEETLPVINPATEEVIAHVPNATEQDLHTAVKSARAAFSKWSATSIDERSELLCKLGDAISANREELATLLTLEMGRPSAAARGEIDGASYWLKEVAKQRLKREIIEETENHLVERYYTPLGVVGAIVPWNFPFALSIWKIAPALLAGNTVVVKPSPYTPLTALKIGEIASEILPAGVLNVVSGGDDLGRWITEHPDVNKISFTGSTATGKKVMQSAATHLKRVTLELGGNDAAIVLPDADPAKIAKPLFWAAFRNTAQVCIATKRMYVHEDIYDAFLAELVTFAKDVKVGNGSDPATDLGPIQNKMQYEKVIDLIEDTKRIGANIVLGGEIEDQPGYFIPVTIVDNPPEDSRVVVEEAFGPVLPVLKYRDYDDVIARVNNTKYGLGGSIWGNDIELAQSIAERLETGTVWINEVSVLSPHYPFGGHKESGIGIEHSLDGLTEYTNSKTIMINKRK
ncbi:aldehyde dehydrogenase family protein [Brevibacillus choshinensis]|uniref:aldehyde dehydrogenase family protein n=1 Tax=Brevibacillus choshinensis TaxID=54911 RepID=UPI002E211D0F|nr:aldehyde dehydrogenase family protein [Brevibacillus choshinensis]MED4779812.1 aldehyde dehydrogenase family protein [Brevibacillus choshinensis]